MIAYRKLPELAALGSVVATIGNFDGVHRGHQQILAEVRARARTLGLKSLAITFEPHPLRVLRPEASPALITPLPQKLTLLAETGIDATLVLPFTHDLSQLTPEQFARQILCDGCGIREIHEGAPFRFGCHGAGDMTLLASFGRELGFEVHPQPPVLLRGAPVSSSRIRKLIAEGKLNQARTLLGRPFAVHSTPASGRGYGTRYTVPTINLAPYPELLPAIGVYVTRMRVAGESFQAVTNVGNRPTFGEDSFTVESHLLDFHPIELREDTAVELTFLHRLRPEIRWPNPEALRAQIGKDVARAQRYFNLTGNSSTLSGQSN